MSAFMSGLVSGFMDTFGAGGGFGDAGNGAIAGGTAGSAAVDTGSASIAADSSQVGSQMAASGAGAPAPSSGGGGMMGGMMGGGGGGGMGGMIPGMGGGGKSAPAPSTAGGSAAGPVNPNANVSGSNAINAGGASMSSAAMQPSDNGIIQNNPYGNAPKQGPTTADYAKAALQGAQKGSQLGQGNQVRNDMNVQMGNSYSALFGSATQVGNYGGGQIGVQPAQMPTTSLQQASLTPPQVASAPAVQAPPIPPAPPPPQAPPMAVSDQLAKKNIRIANKDMDMFLQRVYQNVTTKGKR